MAGQMIYQKIRRMKNVSGVNTAVTNVCILVFDIIMLLAGVKLYYAGIIGFDGTLTTIALFSSFDRQWRWRR